MRTIVDDEIRGDHGQCVRTCPGVSRFDEDGQLRHDEVVPDRLPEDVEDGGAGPSGRPAVGERA